ncbi:hypothetical protein [Aquabacter spiritensis]|uniref:Uncharacterized protein n=1 Tax=Aquabacter spiritensis TaxID=933073 RepID=A0A4R3M4S9_9HYPH|nr:hypothetical protein [Aquabacter spiritensis]TCT08032.1 hypothetical protein EDC64_101551 [Aquabacter spiritensis]
MRGRFGDAPRVRPGLRRLVQFARAMAAVAVCASPPEAARSGAWTQEESAGAAFLQTTATWSDAAFESDGERLSAPAYDKVTTQLFLEYGATDWLTLLFAPELLQVDVGRAVDAPAARYSGSGYTDIGARLRLAHGSWNDGGWVVSAQGILRVPGAKPGEGRAAIGYVDAEFDARLLAGLSFDLVGLPSFVDLELAQRFRFGAAPDEVRFDATLGVEIVPGWLALLQSFNVISEGAGDADPFATSYAYYKVQAGGMVEISPQLSVMLCLVTTWHARNALEETGLVGALLVRY